jgi:hypothetical protein
MNRSIALFALLALLFVGCQSTKSEWTEGNVWYEAPDGSPSKLTEKEAWAIAKIAVIKKEHWPESYRGKDGFIHSVLYGARRTNNGCWKVIAHKSYYSDSPHDCGDAIFEDAPAAIVLVSEKGKVIAYTTCRTDEL